MIDRLCRDAFGTQVVEENMLLLRSEWSLVATVKEELDAEAIADDQ